MSYVSKVSVAFIAGLFPNDAIVYMRGLMGLLYACEVHVPGGVIFYMGCVVHPS